MKRRELLTGLAAAALAGGCASQAPGWVRAGRARYGRPVALPPPAATGTISLEQAIGRRRSRRAFRPDPLPVATIGQLLWAGQGVTSPDGKRAAPSAGALYPLELYVVTASQVLRYLPDGHRAETRAVPDLRPGLTAAAFGQPHVGAAPAIIIVAAVPARTQRKYGTRAEAFAQLEGRPRRPEHPAPGGRPRTRRRARGQPRPGPGSGHPRPAARSDRPVLHPGRPRPVTGPAALRAVRGHSPCRGRPSASGANGPARGRPARGLAPSGMPVR